MSVAICVFPRKCKVAPSFSERCVSRSSHAVGAMQAITWGRRAVFCLHSRDRRSFHAGCVHHTDCTCWLFSSSQVPGDSLDTLLKSKLPLCFAMPSLSCMHARSVRTFNQTPENSLKPVFLNWDAFSSPSCWLGCQTIVMFEGDIPDHQTFCHLFFLQESKRNFKL